MSQKFNIAIIGATGNVGREIIQILEQKNFPIDNLYLLASSRSKGKKIETPNKNEAETVLGKTLNSNKDFEEAVKKISDND